MLKGRLQRLRQPGPSDHSLCNVKRRGLARSQVHSAQRTLAKHGDKYDVLVIGTGGREHAIAWKLSQSPAAHQIFCAPGNAGIAQEPGVEVVDVLNVSNKEDVVSWCHEQSIDLVAIGPEVPLVSGLADALRSANVRVLGPSREAAQLEGSKAFLKGLCERHGIPTAAYRTFTDAKLAKKYIEQQQLPVVLKADGLAAGKGVIIAHSREEALQAIDDILIDQVFGAAGNEIVIEEFLDGEEVSFFALIDGETCLPLASAQDHKAVGEGDTGPNTGGMGAYSPAPAMTPQIERQVMEEIVERTAKAMVAEDKAFQGVLFAGLMIKDGKAKLLEHNIRFGDPECQCLMMRLESDLLQVLLSAASGKLHEIELCWSPKPALCVIIAAEGYPGAYDKNTPIKNLEAITDAKVFHSGTGLDDSGNLVSVGGRVLAVTATGKTINEAQTLAYKAVDQVDWPQGFCRRDIGWRALGRGNSKL